MNTCVYCERFLKCREEMRILDVTTSNEIPDYVLGIDQVCPNQKQDVSGNSKSNG